MASDLCQYCGADLDAGPPKLETGFLYGIECSRCPPDRRRSQVLARVERVLELACPECGGRIPRPEQDPDVLVVKEMTYQLCPECGARCGTWAVRKLCDRSNGTM